VPPGAARTPHPRRYATGITPRPLNFSLSENFSFKSTKLGLEIPHFGEFKSKIEILDIHILTLSASCSCLSENCNFMPEIQLVSTDDAAADSNVRHIWITADENAVN